MNSILKSFFGLALGVVIMIFIIINTPLPTSTETPYPTAAPFPIAHPTATGKLPVGEKVVYAELRPDEITIWAVSIADVSQRRMLFSTKQVSDGGVRFSISPDATRIAYTLFPVDGNVNDPFQAELWVIDLQNGSRTKMADAVDIGRYRNYPIWSPNGRYIAVMRRQDYGDYYLDIALVVDVQSRKEIPAVESKIATFQEAVTSSIYVLDWSRDENNLYYQKGLTEKVDLWNVNIETLVSNRVATIAESGTPRCYKVAPDTSSLLCSVFRVNSEQQFTTSIVVIPISGAQATTIDVPVTSDPIWVSGSSIAVADEANLLLFMDKDATPTVYKARDVTAIEPIGSSMNGHWLAVYTSPETRAGLTLINRDTQEELIISAAEGSEFIGWMP